MTERTWMKKTCELCPFSPTKTLWLHPNRAEDFAFMATNPYSDFPCHKTAVYDEDEFGDGESSGYKFGEHSFTCHGFKALQINECDKEPDFEFCGDNFADAWEMVEHHTEHWEQDHPDWQERLEEAYEQ